MIETFEIIPLQLRWEVVCVACFPDGVAGIRVRPFWHPVRRFWRYSSAVKFVAWPLRGERMITNRKIECDSSIHSHDGGETLCRDGQLYRVRFAFRWRWPRLYTNAPHATASPSG